MNMPEHLGVVPDSANHGIATQHNELTSDIVQEAIDYMNHRIGLLRYEEREDEDYEPNSSDLSESDVSEGEPSGEEANDTPAEDSESTPPSTGRKSKRIRLVNKKKAQKRKAEMIEFDYLDEESDRPLRKKTRCNKPSIVKAKDKTTEGPQRGVLLPQKQSSNYQESQDDDGDGKSNNNNNEPECAFLDSLRDENEKKYMITLSEEDNIDLILPKSREYTVGVNGDEATNFLDKFFHVHEQYNEFVGRALMRIPDKNDSNSWIISDFHSEILKNWKSTLEYASDKLGLASPAINNNDAPCSDSSANNNKTRRGILTNPFAEVIESVKKVEDLYQVADRLVQQMCMSKGNNALWWRANCVAFESLIFCYMLVQGPVLAGSLLFSGIQEVFRWEGLYPDKNKARGEIISHFRKTAHTLFLNHLLNPESEARAMKRWMNHVSSASEYTNDKLSSQEHKDDKVASIENITAEERYYLVVVLMTPLCRGIFDIEEEVAARVSEKFHKAIVPHKDIPEHMVRAIVIPKIFQAVCIKYE